MNNAVLCDDKDLVAAHNLCVTARDDQLVITENCRRAEHSYLE